MPTLQVVSTPATTPSKSTTEAADDHRGGHQPHAICVSNTESHVLMTMPCHHEYAIPTEEVVCFHTRVNICAMHFLKVPTELVLVSSARFRILQTDKRSPLERRTIFYELILFVNFFHINLSLCLNGIPISNDTHCQMS